MIRAAIFLASLSAAALALPAQAQPAQPAQAAISVGAAVKHHPSGEAVGTVTKVDGQYLVVKTGKHEVRLPASSFTPTADGLLFGLTQAQLDAQVEQALAQAQAQIVAGAAVTGAGGASVGTIEAVDAQFVTLKLGSGKAVRLPRSAVAAGPNGVVTSLTIGELEAAAAPAAEPEAQAE